MASIRSEASAKITIKYSGRKVCPRCNTYERYRASRECVRCVKIKNAARFKTAMIEVSTIIGGMNAEGRTPQDIAGHLNTIGKRTQHGNAFSAKGVVEFILASGGKVMNILEPIVAKPSHHERKIRPDRNHPPCDFGPDELDIPPTQEIHLTQINWQGL